MKKIEKNKRGGSIKKVEYFKDREDGLVKKEIIKIEGIKEIVYFKGRLDGIVKIEGTKFDGIKCSSYFYDWM